MGFPHTPRLFAAPRTNHIISYQHIRPARRFSSSSIVPPLIHTGVSLGAKPACAPHRSSTPVQRAPIRHGTHARRWVLRSNDRNSICKSVTYQFTIALTESTATATRRNCTRYGHDSIGLSRAIVIFAACVNVGADTRLLYWILGRMERQNASPTPSCFWSAFAPEARQ